MNWSKENKEFKEFKGLNVLNVLNVLNDFGRLDVRQKKEAVTDSPPLFIITPNPRSP